MVVSFWRCVAYLRQHGAGDHTTLATVYKKNKWSAIRVTNITKTLRKSADIVGAKVGFNFEDISARYM